MSDEEEQQETDEPEKNSSPIKTLIISGLSAIALGGVAAGVAFVMPAKNTSCATAGGEGAVQKTKTKSYEDVAFVNLTPLVVSLGPNANAEFLKISITLETTDDNTKKIEHLKPKFRDVLNTYLRAVDESDLTEPASMMRLRAQILRRIRLVAPDGSVQNVLITDFVLN